MDDARLAIFHPRSLCSEKMRSLTHDWASILWPSSLPWKGDAINPTTGLFLFAKGPVWSWLPEPKSLMVTCVARASSPMRPMKSFQDYHSWIPPGVQEGLLLSVWAKCQNQSSDSECFSLAVAIFALTLFRYHAFPSEVILASFLRWAKRPKCRGVGAHLADTCSKLRETLATGMLHPELRRFAAGLQSQTFRDDFITFE